MPLAAEGARIPFYKKIMKTHDLFSDVRSVNEEERAALLAKKR